MREAGYRDHLKLAHKQDSQHTSIDHTPIGTVYTVGLASLCFLTLIYVYNFFFLMFCIYILFLLQTCFIEF